MPEILLSPEILRSESQKLNSHRNQLNEAVQKIKTLVDSLESGWHGKAQTKFITSFNEKKATYDKFSTDMEAFARFMSEYASAMETTDDGSLSRLDF